MSVNSFTQLIGLGPDGPLRKTFAKAKDLVSRVFVRETQPVQKQIAFTMAFVALAAKMAKADGVAVGVEVEAFERCFIVPENERRNVMRVYELASKDIAGFEVYADRIAKLLATDPTLLRSVFECLFNIAAADGVLHKAEETFLKNVAERFGMDEDDYLFVRRLFVRGDESPYEILGVEPNISDDDLKNHYRQLVRENHPDRLVAEGVPREFLVLADRKLASINTAYDAIKKVRDDRART